VAAVPRTVAFSRLSACLAAVFSAGLALVLAGCVSVTAEPRALLERDDGSVAVQSLACASRIADRVRVSHGPAPEGLDPAAIRIASWNIHKQVDNGWQHDLGTLTARNDVVLLQETVLDPVMRTLIGDAGLRWVMASSFLHADLDIGVLTAARVPPIASCTQRVVEPLLRLPKSAVISWFPIAGRQETLAVANVHAINFSLTLGAYRAQFKALGEALAAHEGPLILAGDLNTWTAERGIAVREVADRLGLTEISFAVDRRSAFLGHQLDHIYTRGLTLVESSTTAVHSSDHNPVAATLRAN
jgi:endonuclease/exonuclease/phosphatase (EEP) superfamily protein YafD